MALFNHVIREVNAKIVYFGPGSGGKETSLTYIYRKLNPEHRSAIKAMTVQGNRMLFFDFHPAEKGTDGYNARFHLYTVTDEVINPSTWKMVLKGADGVVFVADSSPARQQDNLDRLGELQDLLAADGSGVDQIPVVIQYNRRDLPGAVSLEEMQRQLNRFNVPGFPSVATAGEGVLAPLTSLIKMVLAKIRESLAAAGEPMPPETVLSGAESAVPDHPEEAADVSVEGEGRGSGAAEQPSAREEVPSLGEETAGGEVPGSQGEDADDIRLEVAGEGALAAGTLSIPLAVRCGTACRTFRLVVSVEDDSEGTE
jgi:signal recognition particle receptor subunit beta